MSDVKPLIHTFDADMQEIMSWPNTPGSSRYHAAAAGLVEMRNSGGKPRLFPGPETEITKSISDIRRYEERVENLEYQRWAVKEFNDRMNDRMNDWTNDWTGRTTGRTRREINPTP